jgi:hypothetical protein
MEGKDPNKPPQPKSDKAELECEKLRAEIESLRKPLWQTAPFYTGVLPTLLAAIGLAATYFSGWFDVQRTRLTSEKTLLEAQTERLRIDRAALQADTHEQQARVAQVQEEIQKLRTHESDLTNQVAKLGRERDDLRLANEALGAESKRLAGSDAKASQFLEQLTSLQAAREQLLAQVQVLQTSNADLRVTTARQIALIRWANDVLSEGWATALKDRATWSKFQTFGTHVLQLKAASTAFLPEWQVDPDPVPDKSQSTTYDDDLRKQIQRLLSPESIKSYDDYIREAQQRFELLNPIAPHGNSITNKDANSPPPANSL